MSRKRKELPLLEDVQITGLAAEGKSVAKIRKGDSDDANYVVFIPYGAPGDVADIQLERKRKSYAEGRIVRLTHLSDMRVAPKCRHFGVCGGCKWQHLPYQEQLKSKAQQVFDALTRIAKVDFPEMRPILGGEDIWHYRNKMEYTFADRRWRTREEIASGVEFTDNGTALGFHIPGAFDKVLHIDECVLQDDLGNRIRNSLYDFATEHGLSFYNIKENHGLLRTLMIRIATTGQVMVCLQFGEDDPKGIEMVMAHLAKAFPEITSLVYVVNLKLNDTISDQEVVVYRGSDHIEEDMEGLRFRINAKSFYQTNSRQAYRLYSVVRELAGFGDFESKPLVYDLYTGAGTIANFVARDADRVVGIEYVEEAIADAKVNSEVNGISNTLFYAGDMKDVLSDEFVAKHGRPDVMIIDPPRAGMHEDVVKVILNAAPRRLVYVSCNPSTQARDLALLDAKYRVTAVQPVDMFPHTHHIENVVRLDLKS